MNLNKIAVVRAKVMNNKKDVDLEAIYNYISENKIKSNAGWMRRYLGEILLNIDENHLTEAEQWIRKAIEEMAGSVHSIDAIYAGEEIIEEVDTPQDR